MKEIRVFGPPGTGKTTWTSKQITNAAKKYGSDNIFVASFTRAAAAVLVGRDLPVPDSAIGTLHAHCYRMLGSPEIAESKIGDFNVDHQMHALSPRSGINVEDSAVDDSTGQKVGDAKFAQYQILRNRLVPRASWPASVTAFAKAWEGWKNECGFLDFTDMIEKVKDVHFGTPNNALVGFVDEAQDMTPLQFELVRKWGKSLEWFILSGDDDQAIYSFTGASPESLLYPEVPQDQKYILDKSYRVPRAVQEIAEKWIKKVATRQPKRYEPRPFEGEVRRINASVQNPAPAITDAARYTGEGKRVMFLAACTYQLGKLIKELRERGIPYCNPYRLAQGGWNPLASRKGTSASDRLLAYMNPDGPEVGNWKLWSAKQLASWVDFCSAKGLLVNGWAKRIQYLASEDEVSTQVLIDTYRDAFTPSGLDEAIKLSPSWFEQRLKPSVRERMRFPLDVYRKHGEPALTDRPQVVVGTIHSVKGGQADVAYLFPDISREAYKYSCVDKSARDAVVRQFYVGMTRCRESLVLCQPATQFCVKGV